jgi:hypothetical protein
MDALEMYMERLGNEEVVDDVMDMLDIGIPIDVVAGAMLSSGVMNGMHTVDVKLLIRPLVAAHIKSLADVVGVDYKMSMADYEDKDAKARDKRQAKLSAKLSMQTGKIAPSTADEGGQLKLQTEEQLSAEPEDMQMEERPTETAMPDQGAAPTGLMAKG